MSNFFNKNFVMNNNTSLLLIVSLLLIRFSAISCMENTTPRVPTCSSSNIIDNNMVPDYVFTAVEKGYDII